MTEPTTPDAEVIADLARRAEAAKQIEPYSLLNGSDDALLVRTVRHDEHIEVHDLEARLGAPRRNRGTATLYDALDFVGYVQRLSDEYTTVWGDEGNARFTSVFNDHHTWEAAGWRDHTAVLQLQDDPEWAAWIRADGRWFTQQDFAEFLEDRAASVVTPDAATMLEVATEFKAHKKAEFSSGVDLSTGDVQLSYNEETTAKTTKAGQIEVPRKFVVQLSPFLGIPLVQLAARLRWNVDGGQLQIGYRLHRPDLAKRAAFADIRQTIADSLKALDDGDFTVPVLLGTAPQPVVAQR